MQIPAISEIKNLILPDIKQESLQNGAPIHFLHVPDAQYVRFEVIFNAGRLQEKERMTSKGCALLIKERMGTMTGKDIAEYYDMKGSSLQIRNTLDHIFISFVCLRECAVDLIKMTAKICLEPNFNLSDLKKVVRRQKQKLSNELSKTEVIAYREMTGILFGHDSAYGYNSTKERYDLLHVDSIRAFHNDHFLNGNFCIMVTGFVGNKLLDVVKSSFANHKKSSAFFKPQAISMLSIPEHDTFELPNSVQSSLRFFKPLFSRFHSDYSMFFLLNAIFGGYFGSRLMKNVREREGLTYGIYSGIDFLSKCGYFYLSTETQHQNLNLVKDLINEELNLITSVPISEEELLTAKRYISGQFLRMIDGPLNVMKVYRTLALDGLNPDFYSEILTKMWASTPDTLLKLAQTYLKPNSLSTIVVGRMF